MPFRLACTRASIALVIALAAFGAIDACGARPVEHAPGPRGQGGEGGQESGADDGGPGQQSDSGVPHEGGAVPQSDSGTGARSEADGSDGSACGVCTGAMTCQSGQCVCPPGESLCGGTCVDEQNDNLHCGGCGIVCSANSPSTAACTFGLCLVTIVAMQDARGYIAVDATSVYWTDNSLAFGRVMKVSTGGGIPTTLASAQDYPTAIAVDATSVYWTNYSGSVMKVSTGGGTATALAWAQNFPYGAIAVDGTSVYWASGGIDSSGAAAVDSGSVMKLSTGGGIPTTVASGQDGPSTGIAVDATSVYWTNTSSMTKDGRVMKVSITGGTPTTLASGQDTPTRIAVDATSVYWMTGAWTSGGTYAGSIMKVTPK